jgi:hypothetical protein
MCEGGLRGFGGEAVVYGSGWFCGNCVEEVCGSGDVAAYFLDFFTVGCRFEYELSVSGA